MVLEKGVVGLKEVCCLHSICIWYPSPVAHLVVDATLVSMEMHGVRSAVQYGVFLKVVPLFL